jgi:putative ABC transport system permease protein
MRPLVHDIRAAARALAKARLFTTVAVVSLGLALALNTTMFALADAVMHPYVPYPQPERVVVPTFVGGDRKHEVTFDVRLRAVRDGIRSYDRFASYIVLPGALVEARSAEEYHFVAAVSPELFDVLGVRPMYGRAFYASDAGAGATQGAVISFRLWNRLFTARPLSDGLTIDVARTRYTVIGVMPRGVHFPWGATDIWLPLDALPADLSVRRSGVWSVFHLKDGVSIDRVRSEMDIIAARLTAQYTPQRPLTAHVSLLGPAYASPTVFPQFIFATVAMVLIIACANLGTMLIARGMARRRETAIRLALGAGRRDVMRGVLCECAIIVVAGVTLGVLLTWWALYALPHFTIPSVPEIGDLMPVPSWRVFVFALAASIATILVAGALPAIRAAKTDPAEPMKEGAATSTGRVRDRYNPLIVVEVALSTTLLMTSGLFAIVAIRLATFDFRYAAKQLVTADVQVRGKSDDAATARFYDDLIVRAVHIPHTRSAATRHWGTPDGRIIFAEQGKAGEAWMNSKDYAVVSPDYFRTLGISVLRGRGFELGDARGALPVAVVDEQAASRLWPDVPDPVGRMLKLGRKESKAPWLRVIGVAQSIDYVPREILTFPPEPIVYVVVPNDGWRDRMLFVRSDGFNADHGRTTLVSSLRREIESVMPTSGEVVVRPWLDDLDNKRAADGFLASVFAAFAGFGLVLCAVGLYGVLAYTVSRRLREFAVRIALGARRRDVIRLVLHDAAVTALAGVGIGAFFALWITRSIIDDLSGFPYAAVIALLVAESILLAAAFVASLGPVHRAATADPVEVLRAS